MSRKRQSRPRTKAAGPEAAEPSADEGGGSGRMEERASSVRRTEAASVGRNDEPEAAVVRRHGGAGWKRGGQWVRIAAWIAEATGARTAQEEPRHAFDANFPQVQPKRREQREQNRPSARLKGRNWHTSARGGDSIGGCEGRQASQTSVCAAKVFAAGSVRANRRARRAAPLSARNRSAPRRAIGRREIRQAPATASRREAPSVAAPRNRLPRSPASACNRLAPRAQSAAPAPSVTAKSGKRLAISYRVVSSAAALSPAPLCRRKRHSRIAPAHSPLPCPFPRARDVV